MTRLEVTPALKLFVPETWGEATRFQALCYGTHRLDEDTERALAGITTHYGRCLQLTDLAKRLGPKLQTGKRRSQARGRAAAARHEEVGAMVEAAIFELYASVECAARVRRAVHGEDARGLKKLAGFFFGSARKMAGALPERPESFTQGGIWYEDLCRIRDELVCADSGIVRLNEREGWAEYVHPGITIDGMMLVLEDVFVWLEELRGEVNEFLGEVFQQLNGTLKDRPVKTPCGLVGGHPLERWVSPADELTFDSGRCASWQWFEQPENPTCPFKEDCGAYRNKAPAENAE